MGIKLRLLNNLGYDYGLLLLVKWLVLHMPSFIVCCPLFVGRQ